MVGAQHAVEADVAVGFHARQHVRLALVREGFYELLGGAAHVAEMGKENLVLLAEVPDGTRQVIRHQGEVALAEGNAVDRAGVKVQQALVVLDGAHDPSQATDRREGGVIRVHGELQVGFFGHRHHRIQEVLQVLPQRLFGDDAVFGQGGILQ